MYSNALSGLASGMAGGGAPMGGDIAMGGMGEAGGEMMPCPMCQGVGMIPADMMEGGSMLPPRLAARGGGMPGGMDMGGAMQMPPSSSPSPFPR